MQILIHFFWPVIKKSLKKEEPAIIFADFKNHVQHSEQEHAQALVFPAGKFCNIVGALSLSC